MTTTSNKTVSLADLVSPDFEIAFSQLASASLPVKISFAVITLADVIAKHKKHYDASRMILIEKYSNKDEDGKPKLDDSGRNYSIADQSAFDTDYAELLNVEVEVPTLALSSLGDDIKMPPRVLQALLKTVVNPEI